MKYIDRYFHIQQELLDFRNKEDRDINSLFTYLESLHSLSDILKNKHDINSYSEHVVTDHYSPQH